MSGLLEQFKSLTKYWWGVLILGLAVVTVGIYVLASPAESLWGLGIVFAILMLVSGVFSLVVAFTENYLPGRGWIAVEGAIEIVLGILLLTNVTLTSKLFLPFMLAFWLMFRGFGLIGMASDMRKMKVAGMGWTIALAILLILCSFLILFNPMVGAAAIVIWVGIGFIIGGISIVAFSIDLYGIKRKVKKLRDK